MSTPTTDRPNWKLSAEEAKAAEERLNRIKREVAEEKKRRDQRIVRSFSFKRSFA